MVYLILASHACGPPGSRCLANAAARFRSRPRFPARRVKFKNSRIGRISCDASRPDADAGNEGPSRGAFGGSLPFGIIVAPSAFCESAPWMSPISIGPGDAAAKMLPPRGACVRWSFPGEALPVSRITDSGAFIVVGCPGRKGYGAMLFPNEPVLSKQIVRATQNDRSPRLDHIPQAGLSASSQIADFRDGRVGDR